MLLKKSMMEELIHWSGQTFSYLPWRKKRSLFTTLVSEIMLQQTTVGTVQNHFPIFIKKYPNIASIAKLSEEDICIAWKGLGYYRRARNLRKACLTIQQKYNGKIPRSYQDLIEIEGIGPYTANSLIAIGSNEAALALDANLERVLSRIFGFQAPKGPKLLKEIQLKQKKSNWIMNHWLKSFGARKVNEALMDLGRMICQARRAQCELCPFRKGCFAFNNDQVEKLPHHLKIEKEKKLEKFEVNLVRLILKDKKKLAFTKRPVGLWLEGQKELPTFMVDSQDSKLIQYPRLTKKLIPLLSQKPMMVVKNSITKYKITNHVYQIEAKDYKKLLPISLRNSLEFYQNVNSKENFSTVTMKIMKRYIKINEEKKS